MDDCDCKKNWLSTFTDNAMETNQKTPMKLAISYPQIFGEICPENSREIACFIFPQICLRKSCEI